MDDGDLKNGFQGVLQRYAMAREHEPFGISHPLWPIFKSLQRSLETAPPLQNHPHLKVRWSFGKGKWARVPWLAILDTRLTRSIRQGLFCLLVFQEDMQGFYLTLMQGTQGQSRSRLRQLVQKWRRFCQGLKLIGFHLDSGLKVKSARRIEEGYQRGAVAYKFYPAAQLPDDPSFLQDLESLLATYGRCLDQQQPQPGPAPAFQPGPALELLLADIAAQGFYFEPWQIAAYVTALRTKPFVLLAGVSGTGKSHLPGLVAGATGGLARLLPVRPDWTDSSELLGYRDLSNRFRPGLLLQWVRHAREEASRHCICILDEMNLARVEYYLAEILSLMETRTAVPGGGFASQPLLSGNETDPLWQLGLPPNLALVGTVNMDETTHSFSRKVLDRAFTLELSDIALDRWPADQTSSRPAPPWPVSAWYPRAIQLSQLQGLNPQEETDIQAVLQALAEINRFLIPAQLQVGYRVRDEMALFILHARTAEGFFVTAAGEKVSPLDLALHMKILPRLTGGSHVLRRVLLQLLGWSWQGQPCDEQQAEQVLQEWQRVGQGSTLPGARYPRTAARLCLMWERLLYEGYTSFWQ